MYVINDRKTGKRGYIGAWLQRDLALCKVDLLVKNNPEMQDRLEVIEID
jgi:hypothetical protein